MADIYVKSGGGSIGSGSYRGLWSNSQTWAVGDRVAPSVAYATAAARGYIYECTTGGAGGASEPTWVYASPGTSTTTSSAAVFTCRLASSWTDALIDLAGAAANDAAGDTIYVSNNHNENISAQLTFGIAGTLALPTKVICAEDTVTPPSDTAITATIATSGGNAITINGNAYFYGTSFTAGSGASNATLTIGNGNFQQYNNCSFALGTTSGTSTAIHFGLANTGASQKLILNNCSVTLLHNSAQTINLQGINLQMNGGTVNRSTYTGSLFIPFGNSGEAIFAEFNGVDFSNLGSTSNLITGTASTTVCCFGKVIFRNCKLPTEWTGSLKNTTALQMGQIIEMYNCTSSNKDYLLWIEQATGTIKNENTVIRINGASNGTTSLSWNLISGADAEYPHQTLDSPEIVIWNDIVGVPRTVSVDIAGTTSLNNDEIWLEVQYMGEASSPLGYFVSDAKADVLATAAAQDPSFVTWSGIDNPVKQKLSVTFTPQKRGFIHAVVKLAKPSTTVYVDPKLNVS